jgi:hypothetical protein
MAITLRRKPRRSRRDEQGSSYELGWLAKEIRVELLMEIELNVSGD